MHTANQRSDALHKLTTALVQTCDGVALEDLPIRNMVRNHHLSKSILDSGWGMFKQYLTYKAASAGRELCLVNPAYISSCCSNCEREFQDFDLSTRWVKCRCGLSLDRDHNAAINILKRAGWDTGSRRTRSPRLSLTAATQGVGSVTSILSFNVEHLFGNGDKVGDERIRRLWSKIN